MVDPISDKTMEQVRGIRATMKLLFHAFGVSQPEVYALLDEAENPLEPEPDPPARVWKVHRESILPTGKVFPDNYYVDLVARRAIADTLRALRPVAAVLSEFAPNADDREKAWTDFLDFLDSVGAK